MSHKIIQAFVAHCWQSAVILNMWLLSLAVQPLPAHSDPKEGNMQYYLLCPLMDKNQEYQI